MMQIITNLVPKVIPRSPELGPPLPNVLNVNWPTGWASKIPGINQLGSTYRDIKFKIMR